MFKKTLHEKNLIQETKSRRGEEARALLENALLKQALGEIERDTLFRMKRLNRDDVAGMEILWREMNAHDDFRSKLVKYIKDGELARKTLLEQVKDKLKPKDRR
jgi:hypothetical protein